jgi:alpha-amylase
MGGRSAVFDFALHYTLEAMCNNASNWNMAQLDHAGLAGISPMQAVTFVENPDTDTDGFGSVKFNKILAYAYILTSEGYPCVYYRDYSTDADCYGLKPHIDTLIWIHENLAFGSTVERWKDFQCFAYERLGAPNLLVALNNNGSGGWRTITVQTAFGANVQLHDYSGHAGDVWTDANGMVTIGVPQNDDGLGYVCYSRTGYGAAFTVNGLAVTQEFFGADDLDIGPLVDSASIDVGPCWCAEGTPIAATLAPPATGVSATTSVDVALVGPDGAIVATGRWLESAQQALTVHAVAKNEGWYTARLSAVNLADLSIPFSLTMQYCAPRKL